MININGNVIDGNNIFAELFEVINGEPVRITENKITNNAMLIKIDGKEVIAINKNSNITVTGFNFLLE